MNTHGVFAYSNLRSTSDAELLQSKPPPPSHVRSTASVPCTSASLVVVATHIRHLHHALSRKVSLATCPPARQRVCDHIEHTMHNHDPSRTAETSPMLSWHVVLVTRPVLPSPHEATVPIPARLGLRHRLVGRYGTTQLPSPRRATRQQPPPFPSLPPRFQSPAPALPRTRTDV